MTEAEQRQGAIAFVTKTTARTCSELGERVAYVLARAYGGLHQLPSSSIRRVEWDDDYVMSIFVRDGLATVDFPTLTALVVLCHDELLRMEVRACNPGRIALWFWKRKARSGGMGERCPTIEDHIKLWRPRPPEAA